MYLCCNCKNGEYRGFPKCSSPEWEVGTVYFWCPIKEHHDQYRTPCKRFEFGTCKKFDKFGNLLEG